MHDDEVALEMAHAHSRDLRRAARRDRLARACPRPGDPWRRSLAWTGGLDCPGP